MLRRTAIAGLLVLVLSTGLLNWSTSCCCGRSMVLQLLVGTEGGCAHHHRLAGGSMTGHHHGAAPAGANDPLHEPHRCYKSGDDWSPTKAVSVVPPTWQSIDWLQAVATLWQPLLFTAGTEPVVERTGPPTGPPPDLVIVHQQFLI